MNHNDIVRQSFKKQAEKFVAYHMSKVEYTDYLIQKIAATGEEHALEVAAGTCICGRALAPYVKDITCLDMTEEMLGDSTGGSIPLSPVPPIGCIWLIYRMNLLSDSTLFHILSTLHK